MSKVLCYGGGRKFLNWFSFVPFWFSPEPGSLLMMKKSDGNWKWVAFVVLLPKKWSSTAYISKDHVVCFCLDWTMCDMAPNALLLLSSLFSSFCTVFLPRLCCGWLVCNYRWKWLCKLLDVSGKPRSGKFVKAPISNDLHGWLVLFGFVVLCLPYCNHLASFQASIEPAYCDLTRLTAFFSDCADSNPSGFDRWKYMNRCFNPAMDTKKRKSWCFFFSLAFLNLPYNTRTHPPPDMNSSTIHVTRNLSLPRIRNVRFMRGLKIMGHAQWKKQRVK